MTMLVSPSGESRLSLLAHGHRDNNPSELKVWQTGQNQFFDRGSILCVQKAPPSVAQGTAKHRGQC